MSCGGGVCAGWARGRRPGGCAGAGPARLLGGVLLLIAVFGERIGADLGWSASLVHGGFSLALLVMGLASGPCGRVIDRHGGRPVMVAGSLLTALGCAWLAAAHGVASYYAA